MGSTADKNESEKKTVNAPESATSTKPASSIGKEDVYESDKETRTKHSQHKELKNYEEFKKYTDGIKLNNDKIIYFYFEGSKDSSGKSWCSDCIAAEPYVEAAWEKYKTDNSEFIIVYVGDRPTFKDNKCLFRLDKEINVTNIPTIIRWKTQRRLVTEQLLKNSLLEMMFTEDDDE